MNHTGLICGFLLVSAFSLSGATIILDSDNFDAFIRSHKVVLVDFYAPWCGHCKKMAPAYDEAAMRLSAQAPELAMAKIDCAGKGKMVCERLGVDAFPTMLLFRDGRRMEGEYEEGRNADALFRFMMSVRPGAPSLFGDQQQAQQPMPVAQPVAQPVQPVAQPPVQPVARPAAYPVQQGYKPGQPLQVVRPNPPTQAVMPQVQKALPPPNLPNAVNLANPKNAPVNNQAIKPSAYPAQLQRLTPEIVGRIINLINAGKIHARHHIPKVTNAHYKVTTELANRIHDMMTADLAAKTNIPGSGGDDEDIKPKANEVEAPIDFANKLQNAINKVMQQRSKGKKQGVKLDLTKQKLKVSN